MGLLADIRPYQPDLTIVPKPKRPVLVAKPTPRTRSLDTLAISTLRIIGLELVRAGLGDKDTAILPLVRKLIRRVQAAQTTITTLRHELMEARLEVVTLKRQLVECQEKDTKGKESGQESNSSIRV